MNAYEHVSVLYDACTSKEPQFQPKCLSFLCFFYVKNMCKSSKFWMAGGRRKQTSFYYNITSMVNRMKKQRQKLSSFKWYL